MYNAEVKNAKQNVPSKTYTNPKQITIHLLQLTCQKVYITAIALPFQGQYPHNASSIEGLSSEEAWFKLGDSLKIPRPDGTRPTRPDIEPGLAQHYHKALMA